MPTLFGKEFGLNAAKTVSASALAAVMAFTPAAAQEATQTSAEPTSAAHIQADVIFSYGADIDPNIVNRHVRGLATRDIVAVATQDLEVADCLAVIIEGEERFRFASADIRTPAMSGTVVNLLAGNPTGFTSSTCPDSIDLAALTPEN